MNILIFGATSAIAQAVAVRYAAAENRFYLVARNAGKSWRRCIGGLSIPAPARLKRREPTWPDSKIIRH